jgi:hypothetical protein
MDACGTSNISAQPVNGIILPAQLFPPKVQKPPMKTVFRVLKILAMLLTALGLTLGIVVWRSFSGLQPISDGQRLDGVEVVKDRFVSAFIVDLGDRAFRPTTAV